MHDLEAKAAPTPSPAPATETASAAPVSASIPRTREPEILTQGDSSARAVEDDTELLDYVDRESFRSGMQRVLKKKPRNTAPKLTDLSDIPAT